jgi:Ca2+/H+ antiporter, TMEM165/GDT1 family
VDALMAAIVLGALCQAGDRTPWLAAILADRFERKRVVIAGLIVAFAFNYALGTLGGIYIAPMISPEAKLVFLGLALGFAGLETPLRSRSPDRLEGWRIGAVATSVLGLVIIAFADRMQFVAAALAARSPLPWLAAVGAVLGALAVAVPATLIGEAKWLALPQRAIRFGTGAILLIAGIACLLNGLRLI